ncbi:ribokinase [Sporanaerobacter acetigenes]|uniref:Ribokinase n=1 Tax=Sporanaerobacter acetigenes DSM 13106 TaxID=1123281 RepID=A0A1M5VBX3_9FIRM|nr:ribokinase [Sporanaerobacter acetigenes]SHH72772.1 ribokinase [Sporanaerobacter acetigenes DSM 13106]
MKIVVVGSINVDYNFLVKELPKEGETIMAKDLLLVPGGKGANQAVAARKLGGDVFFIGAVGNDSIGKEMKENLLENEISSDGIVEVEGNTGMASINISDSKENSIIVYPGANQKLSKEHIKKFEEKIKESEVVLIQLEIPMDTVVETIVLAKKYNKRVILNPAPARQIPEEIFKYIHIITPNETELETLTGTKDIEKGSEILLRKGVDKVIITLGSKGCLYVDKNEKRYFESFTVDSSDPTAAGDTFNGAIAVKIDHSLEKMIEFASGAAALATTKIGAQNSIPSQKEVESFLLQQGQQSHCRKNQKRTDRA